MENLDGITGVQFGETIMTLLKSSFSHIILLSGMLLGGREYAQGQKADVQSPAQFVRLVRLARTSDGLHKAALANGGVYVTSGRGHSWIRAGSVDDLVSSSSTIVIGQVTGHKAVLVNNGRDIRTEYTFRLDTVLKGTPNIAVVTLPGGTYKFDDGSIAKVDNEGVAPRLLKDHKYLIFGRAVDGLQETITPSPEDQGVFELGPGGTRVFSHTTQPGDAIGSLSGISQTELLDEVRKSVAKDASGK